MNNYFKTLPKKIIFNIILAKEIAICLESKNIFINSIKFVDKIKRIL